MSEMTALLVEDLDETREMYAWHLRKNNIRVLEAENKEDAIKIYKKWASHISLVFTDWRLVDKEEDDNSGVELAKEIKKLNPDQSIICMTAYHRPEEVAGSDVFDGFYEKSPSEDREGFLFNLPKIIDLSEERRKREKEKIPQELLAIKEKYRISEQDFHVLVQNRPLTPGIEKALLAFHISSEIDYEENKEEYLERIGKPILVNPNDKTVVGSEKLAAPLIVVVKESEGYVIAELYGHPMIYTYGGTDKESISLLIELLMDYSGELEEDNECATKDVVKFSNYLAELLGI